MQSSKQAGCVRARNSRPNVAATRAVQCCTGRDSNIKGDKVIVKGDKALLRVFNIRIFKLIMVINVIKVN